MSQVVPTFNSRISSLGPVSGGRVAKVVTASADIALFVDNSGVIQDVYTAPDTTITEASDWLGQKWVDTVTAETRPKVEQMLEALESEDSAPRRQVNHELSSGRDTPVLYTAVRLSDDRVVAIGTNLAAVAALQQQLVRAQQAMERDYWHLRHVETRYRLLFQLSAEPILVIDADSMKVLETNPAAASLFGAGAKDIIGKSFPVGLPADAAESIRRYLSNAAARGAGAPLEIRVDEDAEPWTIRAEPFRLDRDQLLLVSIRTDDGHGTDTNGMPSRVMQILEQAPDGFVVTDAEGKILSANQAFLDLAQLSVEEEARGQSLERWLGRPGADLKTLLSSLRDHGSVRLFATALNGQHGATAEVEISGVLSPGEPRLVGLTLRDLGRRLGAAPEGARDLTQAVEELTGLVGKVSLKKLVRDTTALVERHFIEAALDLADNNRTLAAEMLGVSRQSLYTKLRRYRMDEDLTPP